MLPLGYRWRSLHLVALHTDARERDLNKNQRRVTRGRRTPLDPSPHAIPGNSEQYKEQKTAYLCGIRKPVQHSATTDRALVMR